MADPARARKLAVRIRQIVSSAIESQIKDPRLGMVTITDARVTNDLREATVFYTVYGDPTQVEDSARALTSATGVLRSTVGKQTGIKFVPSLSFVADVDPRRRPPGAGAGAARRRGAGPGARGGLVRGRAGPVPAPGGRRRGS